MPIKSFYEDKSDTELYLMSYVLEQMAKVNDVRECIKEIVYMNQVNYETAKEYFSELQEESHHKENSRYGGSNANNTFNSDKKE